MRLSDARQLTRTIMLVETKIFTDINIHTHAHAGHRKILSTVSYSTINAYTRKHTHKYM